MPSVRRKKVNKKTYHASVILNGKRMPDFGLGPGVLRRETVSFKDTGNYGFDSELFKAALAEYEARLLRQMVRVEWFEVK